MEFCNDPPSLHCERSVMYASATPSRNFRNEMENGAEMNPAVVSGILTGDTPVSYCPTCFPLSLVIVPEVLAKLTRPSFLIFFLSGEFATF